MYLYIIIDARKRFYLILQRINFLFHLDTLIRTDINPWYSKRSPKLYTDSITFILRKMSKPYMLVKNVITRFGLAANSASSDIKLVP